MSTRWPRPATSRNLASDGGLTASGQRLFWMSGCAWSGGRRSINGANAAKTFSPRSHGDTEKNLEPEKMNKTIHGFSPCLRASVVNLLASRVEKFSTEAAAQQYKLH